MIAGLLALVIMTGDTTTRFASIGIDTLDAPVTMGAALPVPMPATPAVTESSSVDAAALRVTAAPRLEWRAPDDTLPRKKRKLVAYSDWYGRRLSIHKTLSWAMLPLFGVSYYTGTRLANDGRSSSPYWVRASHPWVATADAAIFGINTVTGVWNLWDARHDPEGRTRRIIHSVLFIAADAGFAYAGSIGEEARNNGETRTRHRNIAIGSMGVSTLGWLIMLIGN
jgi:hypothetical protein